MNLVLLLGMTLGSSLSKGNLTAPLVGQPVDIASSAYQYRSDRRADSNPPESWLALMHFAHQPLNKPVDRNAPPIKHCLASLLWEEIRPVQTIVLAWPKSAKNRPAPEALVVSTLMNQGASSSWWNNLASVPQTVKPTVSDDGVTYTYAIGLNVTGIVIATDGAEDASKYDVPQVHAFVADTWKQENVEIEWAYEKGRSDKDFSGRIETYDGQITNLKPLTGDTRTTVTDASSWRSEGKSAARRGVKLNLLYSGGAKWRKQQAYTTQADDVARTIVTVWTKSGSFSFLAADLENGPILAPEYGFFVRRTSSLPVASRTAPARPAVIPFTTKMDSVVQSSSINGWGTGDTPLFCSNATSETVSSLGVQFPAHCIAVHPGPYSDVTVGWHSPIKGVVKLTASVAHAQAGSNGIEWWLTQDPNPNHDGNGRSILANGATNGTGSQSIPSDGGQASKLDAVNVQPGDVLSLVVGPNGDYRCDTTIVTWTIAEVGGEGRSWSLGPEVATSVLEGNPHADKLGNPDVWRFGSEMPMNSSSKPSEPPITLASSAATAEEFVKELSSRRLKTIREQTREHVEQTWEGAVTATRGANLPVHPEPPAGAEPSMQVEVPSARLTAQWKLGSWHLLRHCGVNPTTGKRWFNDFPYGILAAETYLVLSVLDQMGEHQAAAEGFDQWLSLPLDREHPVGQFSDGQGALTNAVGPDGYGGQMDGIHSFGPGSIGWALTQHYWMTGDANWLKTSEPRLLANAEWMLRQRRVVSGMVPGGERLWCKGLQPALQVTPDSGGLWMQFYECEAYYCASVMRLADTLTAVDPAGAAKLKAEAESYRKDLRAAVDRSIALSPVVPVRDGTFHSVIPFACYARGLSTGAWGWQRDGSGSHVGQLYWDTVQSAAALISPASILPADDVRVQGYLDVLEDRLLLENPNVGNRDWFEAGWQYQGGLERTANMHLAADDIPVFLRSFLNCYAVDILPNDGYVFNEHAVHGPPDKIFEEAAFLERFRNLLVMEDGSNLWLTRGTPREWLEQGKKISVQHAPSKFGEVGYEITSEVTDGKILATISMPSRNSPKEVWLRLRHPKATPIASVQVNGKPWNDFDRTREIVKLHGLANTVKVEVRY